MLFSEPPSSVLFWSVSAILLGLLGTAYSIVYQLCWSPLRRFPGPRLWAVSRIPGQLSVLHGHHHLDLTALHEQYGSVLRISPHELAFNTPQAFRDIYGARPGGCFPKDRTHYLPPANGVNHLVCEVDHTSHARQRRLLSHAFSERALRDQESLITSYVDTMIFKLHLEIQRSSSCVDIKHWMNFTTFDITGDLIFGESFNCLKDSKLHPWIELIFKSIKALALDGITRQFPVLRTFLRAFIPRRIQQKAVEHFKLAAKRVDKRLETQTTRPDFMAAILQNGLSESNGKYQAGKRIMTRAEIHSNAFIFADDKDMTFRSCATLPYLAAVIEESLRMYPPFTVVACHHYATYHSSSNFALPDNFIPERWLGKDARFDGDKKDALQPFSLGPRNCLGKKYVSTGSTALSSAVTKKQLFSLSLAYCEMRLILCKLLYHFDFMLCPESANWTDQKVYFLWDKPALMVTLKPRLKNENRTES
ncbi:hypothetical protein N7462_011508 [Penicillium macrosclerotiorum]|uniref:uncharacterized protein n=1 Tax=Penicillium macrosclerotiorum TaxID=303699 RepID=UPI002548C646|nr:uncharacterized protein N7462_011508 [Penicillium macrosclerotiorum]KAJ5664695.1 hypothetical protein N7462_011508 [Penicillium macrosclerotiorum]